MCFALLQQNHPASTHLIIKILISTMSDMVSQRVNSLASRKLFIQMSGAPGSGKSTVARLLGKSIQGVVFDHDQYRSAMLEQMEKYSPETAKKDVFDLAAKLTYSCGWVWAQEMAKQGRNLVMDSICNFREVLEHGTALAQQYGYEYWYVECKVEDINVLEARLGAREPLRSQRTSVHRPPLAASDARKGEDHRAVFEGWMKNMCRPGKDGNVVIVNSTVSMEECRDEILAKVNGSRDRHLDV